MSFYVHDAARVVGDAARCGSLGGRNFTRPTRPTRPTPLAQGLEKNPVSWE